MTFRVAVDIGGTFTDAAVLAEGGIISAKSPTTPANPAEGVLDALRIAGSQLGLSVDQLLADTTHFVHGTTIGTNALIERTGARTGLITTKGHEDTLPMGRIFAKRAGLSEREIIHTSRLNKPSPIVPRDLIVGVSERVDYAGDVVVPLSEEEVRAAVRYLLDCGVEAIAVSYLWSFVNSDHELRTKEIVAELAPSLFVTASSEIAPVLGEYERTVTTVLNCYLGPKVRGYLEHLSAESKNLEYSQVLLVMQSNGGVAPAEAAMQNAVSTIDSGPVGGALGARYFEGQVGQENIICTDVGGTSFDVALVHEGGLQLEKQPVISQYVFNAPKILIQSIGAGGGSIAWRDDLGYLRVGPRSSGSQPGPACYGRGGSEPTLTDADLLLGFLNPEHFLGGRQKLQVDLAQKAFDELAKDLGMDVIESAWGVVRIASAQMADLIRRTTIEQGYDPRDFVVVAYGGAGPVHAAFYASDIEAKYLVIPREASVFSALGMLSADVVHTVEKSLPMRSPLSPEDVAQVNGLFRSQTEEVLRLFDSEGYARDAVRIGWSAFLRYQAQVHELEVELPIRDFESEDEQLIGDLFRERYSAVFGEGSGFEAAGFELMTFRVTGSADPGKPDVLPLAQGTGERSLKESRDVFFGDSFIESEIHDGSRLQPGQAIRGPAIIERMGDTVVIPPSAKGTVDTYGNIRMDLSAQGGA